MTLFKFGDFEFLEYVLLDTYSIIPNARLDSDSYTDANGVLHRDTLEHTKTKIEFITTELSQSEMKQIMEGLTSNYIDYKQRNAICTYFDTETFKEKTGRFYLDSSFKMKIKEIRNGEFIFGQTQFVFVEY